MPRCAQCGRRFTGPHPGCAGLAAPAPAPSSPEVSTFEALSPAGYVLEQLLGRGGFGLVLAAHREPGGEKVALKTAPSGLPLARNQLAREAEALLAVGPPAVPRLFGSGNLADGSPYLVLERIAWPTLADRLEAACGLPLAVGELGALAHAVTAALARVHAAGFAHGDLKPENIFVSLEPPAARLFDLGLAERITHSGPSALPHGFWAGTPEYMAPEQCQGQLRINARTDVYAAGVILFEMLTGRTPFFGTAAEVRQAHANRRPQPPSELAPVPLALEAVCLRCLAKEPEARFASGRELEAALADALGCEVRVVARTVPAAPGPPPPERRPAAVIFLESGAGLMELRAAAQALGGQIAHAAGSRYALVFDASADENPVRLAVRSAGGLVERGLAPRALVDLAPVSVRRRSEGPSRFFSTAFARIESYPCASDPPGALITARAAEVVPELAALAVPSDRGLYRVAHPLPAPEEPTVVQAGSGSLIGRDAILRAVLEEAEAGFGAQSSRLVTILGEAGTGKTHLAAALAQRLRTLHEAPRVLELRAREPLPGEDGETFRALARWALGLGPAAAPGGARGLSGGALFGPSGEPGWPALALALGLIGSDAPELTGRFAAPGALRLAAVRAAGDALRRRAQVRPVCVVLDDAHLADGATLDALEYAGLSESRSPILVCAVARPVFSSARPSFGERAGHFRTIALEPLDTQAGSALCARLLWPAESVPRQAVDHLVARARGVPALLVELVRGLKREGLVRRHGRGAWFLATDELDRLPELPLIEWLAERELESLPSDLRAHAQLASALGDEFLAEEMAGILGELTRSGHGSVFPLDARAAIRRLLGVGILVRHREDRLGFRQPLVREMVARSLSEPVRRAIHEAAVRYYSGARALSEHRRLARLAHHASEGGRLAEAGAMHLGLAERLRGQHAYLEAEALFTRALGELPPSDLAPRLATFRGRGLMRYRIGRSEDSIADLKEAEGIARALEDRIAEAECLLDEATCLDWMSDYPRSSARVEEASRLAQGLETASLRARLELARGRALFRACAWREACERLEEAARLAEPLGDLGYESYLIALLLLGTALPQQGRSEEAERVLQRAADLCHAHGDLLHLSAVLSNGRNLRVARRDLGGAVADQEASIRIGRELGMAGIEYYGEYNIGELTYQAGDPASAEPHVQRAVELEELHPEVAPVPVGLLLWARLLLFRGDLTAAGARLEALRAAVARSSGRLGPSDDVLVSMVELALRGGEEAEWRELAERSRRFSIEQEPIEVMEMWGLAAFRAGHRAEARTALEAALELCRAIPSLMEERIRRELAGLDHPGLA